MLQELSSASIQVGLEMNLHKTQVMTLDNRSILLNNHPLETVDEYVYLGHLIQLGKKNQTAEINRRIRASWAAFGKLGYILKNPDIPINLKSKVFDTCVLPVATYELETYHPNKK